MIDPSYTCPVCGTLSTLIIGPTQAFCTNITDCQVVVFDPSLPDGGASKPEFRERPAWMEGE